MQRKPRGRVFAVHVHHGVLGLGDGFWDHYLLPLRRQLEADGCELRETHLVSTAT